MGRIEVGKALFPRALKRPMSAPHRDADATLFPRALKRLVCDTGPPERRTQDQQIVLSSRPVPTVLGGGS